MYRILIVDDEPLVRRGITKSVNWNELDIEMVAEAENGIEAMEQVLENVPDIILLDICMPRMDGLEFASIVKKQYPNIKIVIITGFDDFEYARSALRSGVDDYILKPITKEMVAGVVRAQLDRIEEEREKKEPEKANDAKAAAILNSVLKQEARSQQEIPSFCEYTGLEDKDVYFVIMKDYLADCKMWSEETDDQLAEFAILNIAGELLQSAGNGFAFETYKNELAMVICGNQRHKLEHILTEIYENILGFIEIPVDFAISAVGELKELPRMAEQARQALTCTFVLTDQNVIFYEDIITHRESEFSYPEQIEREILAAMFANDTSVQQTNEQISEFFRRVKEVTPDVAKCKSMLLRLLLKISNTIESVNSRMQAQSDHQVVSFDPVRLLETFNTMDEAEIWLKKLYAETIDYVSSMKSRTGQLFLKIKNYIEKNYGESSLNLKKCSEDLFLSSGYISMTLKKSTGKTFVDYLNEFRVEKAAQLLTQPESKVYEVAMEVGFTHQTYFSSVFKKIMGTSPKQYKEQC